MERKSRSIHPLCMVSVMMCGFISPHAIAGSTEEFKYDELGRLIEVHDESGLIREYEYDAAGNRVEVGDTNAPPNGAPTANDDATTVPGPFQEVYVNLGSNDTDPENDPLTITAVTQPANAAVSILSGTYVSIFSHWSGTYTFTYTISDGNGNTDTANVLLTVSAGGGNPWQ